MIYSHYFTHFQHFHSNSYLEHINQFMNNNWMFSVDTSNHFFWWKWHHFQWILSVIFIVVVFVYCCMEYVFHSIFSQKNQWYTQFSTCSNSQFSTLNDYFFLCSIISKWKSKIEFADGTELIQTNGVFDVVFDCMMLHNHYCFHWAILNCKIERIH